MIRTLDLRGRTLGRSELAALVPRSLVDVSSASETAAQLIADVREHGSAALFDQAERLDRVRPPALKVSVEELDRAKHALDPKLREAILASIARVRAASAAQLPPPRVTDIAAGARIEQRFQAMRRAGLYIPGGKAVYPSSVIMNVVPAQTAGVSSLALVSPPQADFAGSVHPTILAVAALLGVDEVYALGGAGAIGALAYGVSDLGLEPVDVITGPGNVYVAAAKRLVRGVVAIDAEAGPTDILVLADESADAHLVAVDLVSQAEHDELAAAALVTNSPELANEVAKNLVEVVARTKHASRIRAALAGPQSAIVLVDSVEAGADFVNAFAPEHLEIHTKNSEDTLPLIKNAGVIFLGAHAPVSLGDYLAGSNHVLPTAGQARFSAALSALTFLRPQQIVRYDRDALHQVAHHIRVFSDAEDLPAHGDAVTARFI